MVALPRLARFRTVMENRQSEFLQFSLFIAATIWLVQKGSNESKSSRLRSPLRSAVVGRRGHHSELRLLGRDGHLTRCLTDAAKDALRAARGEVIARFGQ